MHWLALAASMLDLPNVTAVTAIPVSGRYAECPSLDLDGGSFCQRLDYFAARLIYDPLQGGAGDIHLLSRFLLIKLIQIYQA